MCKYAEVPLVWHQSRCTKFFNNLDVGFIDIACAGALNPAFGLQGYVTEHLFTVTTLLVDRSLVNSGLHRNEKFVICIEPQHYHVAGENKPLG
jgi:hypothetical protein